MAERTLREGEKLGREIMIANGLNPLVDTATDGMRIVSHEFGIFMRVWLATTVTGPARGYAPVQVDFCGPSGWQTIRSFGLQRDESTHRLYSADSSYGDKFEYTSEELNAALVQALEFVKSSLSGCVADIPV